MATTEKRRRQLAEANRRWRSRNPEKVRAHKQATYRRHALKWFERSLRAKYGISLADWCHLLDIHDGRCAVCGSEDNLVVDHDHTRIGPDSVRGILCSKCNRSLGFAGDSADRLRSLAEYLDSHK